MFLFITLEFSTVDSQLAETKVADLKSFSLGLNYNLSPVLSISVNSLLHIDGKRPYKYVTFTTESTNRFTFNASAYLERNSFGTN